ncbi:MAG: type II toxin-antitoxin system HicB family antitoxin [Methanosarcinaceae archaeon]|nr:type II toxin-antitoxin system HicB family antitoxin [Methanosarcinaceae archaeon]
MYRFLIIIEKANENYSAYSPDLPGCVATGATREETERNMYEAIEMHIQGLLEDKLPIPESNSFAEYVALDEKSGTFADIVQTA